LLEHTDIPKVGCCCTNAIQGHCCATVTLGRSCTSVIRGPVVAQQWEPLDSFVGGFQVGSKNGASGHIVAKKRDRQTWTGPLRCFLLTLEREERLLIVVWPVKTGLMIQFNSAPHSL
jgi:hypothetical protein